MVKFDWENLTVEPYIQRRLDILEAMAKGDDTYRLLREALDEQEERYLAIESSIPADLRDIILDYFDLREAMAHRLTELACKYMELPSPNDP